MLAFLSLAPQFDPDEPSKRRRQGAVTTPHGLQSKYEIDHSSLLRSSSPINILLRLGWLGFIAWLLVHAFRANVLYALERHTRRAP
jgi:hypothetical protein